MRRNIELIAGSRGRAGTLTAVKSSVNGCAGTAGVSRLAEVDLSGAVGVEVNMSPNTARGVPGRTG
jgi:hypothetical protein